MVSSDRAVYGIRSEVSPINSQSYSSHVSRGNSIVTIAKHAVHYMI